MLMIRRMVYIKKYDYNGNLWDICSYVDGKMNGEFKYYHENGQLWRDCSYKNGEINGGRNCIL